MELQRFFIVELAQVAVALQHDCTPNSCPMMCAGATEFLCASHNPPREVRPAAEACPQVEKWKGCHAARRTAAHTPVASWSAARGLSQTNASCFPTPPSATPAPT